MASMSKHLLLLLAVTSLVTGGAARAGTLVVSASGQFSSTDISAPPLEQPNGTFTFSFAVDSNPLVSNVSASGFDVVFQNFLYKLNNTAVNVAPGEIRFSSTANGGLFTLFFGPES